MKRFSYILILLAAVVSGCHNDDDFDALPRDISSFVCQYWPNPSIESYTHPKADEYVVILRDGPELNFDAAYQWTEIDGCGLPLPQVLLYDQLPEKLYDYLEATQQTNAVFELERTARIYKVELLDTELTYDIKSQTIRGATASQSGE